jgi:MFS family permease
MAPVFGPVPLDGPAEFTPAGRRMLAASIITQLFGGTMAIGLFPVLLLPISAGFGWSRTESGSMAGVTALTAAIGLPVWGALVDRYGVRPMVLVATALTGLAFWALALQSGSLVQSYVSYAVMGFASGVSVAQVKALALRFVRNRGLVLALLGITVGLCFSLTPIAGKLVLDHYGWRAVYGGFGFLPIVISLPLLVAWFHMPAPSAVLSNDRGIGFTLGAAIRTTNFWLIVMLASCSGFVFAGMQVHLVAFLQDRGLGGQRAVDVLSVAAFGALVCQVMTGWLLDRFRSPRAAIPFVAIAMVGMLLLQLSPDAGATIAGTIALQSGVGGELSLMPYLVSCAFGTGSLARIFGTAALIAQVLSSASPVMLGVIHDRTTSYADALPVFLFLLCCSVGLILLLGNRIVIAAPARLPSRKTAAVQNATSSD